MHLKNNGLILINKRVFPFLTAATFLFLVVDLFKYSGFIEKHVRISSYLMLNILFASGILFILSSNNKNLSTVSKKIFEVNNIFFPIILIFSLIIHNIDSHNPAGYIFSLLHIHPGGLIHILVLSLFILLIQIFPKDKKLFGW